MEWIDPKTAYTLMHLMGVVLGAGAAFVGDILFSLFNKGQTFGQKRAAPNEDDWYGCVGRAWALVNFGNIIVPD